MGLFDIFKKKKTIDWSAMSIAELESVIISKTYPSVDDKQFCWVNYVHRIIESHKTIGGFGGDKSFISDNQTIKYLMQSIMKWGVYSKKLPNGKIIVNNHVLHFVKNYIEHKFVSPINPACIKSIMADLLGEFAEDEQERRDALKLKMLIEDANSDLYTSGLYSKYNDYKFFIALQMHKENFYDEFPMYKKTNSGEWTGEYLTIADIADLDPENAEAFIDNCIREDE